jgi:hypothetical protein
MQIWEIARLPTEATIRRAPGMRASRRGKRKNTLGGPRKSLIRLDSDKEIKVNLLDSLWPGFAGFGSILPNLA